MELTQVEALADLISAETKKQKDKAVKQIKGELSNRYNIWRQSLITMRARIEAHLDFMDETDVQDHNESLDVSKEIKREFLVLKYKNDEFVRTESLILLYKSLIL